MNMGELEHLNPHEGNWPPQACHNKEHEERMDIVFYMADAELNSDVKYHHNVSLFKSKIWTKKELMQYTVSRISTMSAVADAPLHTAQYQCIAWAIVAAHIV